jgi:hypothetical protein
MLYLKSLYALTDSLGELADVIPSCYYTGQDLTSLSLGLSTQVPNASALYNLV